MLTEEETMVILEREYAKAKAEGREGPTWTREGPNLLTMEEAMVEMRARTEIGRIVLEQYQVGFSVMVENGRLKL